MLLYLSAVMQQTFWETFYVSFLNILLSSVIVYLRELDSSTTSACSIYNKKLRYRKEHSTSVVLSWCTL